MEVVLASSNKNKINEIKKFLSSDIKLRIQSEFDIPDIEETGSTFVENAILKAKNACKYTGLPALADDSGLVVPSLGGAPGIYSKRYADNNGDYEANRNKLLEELHGKKGSERDAYIICVLAFCRSVDDPLPEISIGKLVGSISYEKKGDYNFGYNSIFYLKEYDKNLAELPIDEIKRISHRALALKKMQESLAL